MATLKIFAATDYNCGAYGSSVYSGTADQCATATGSLADTGFDVLLPVFLGISLIGASAILIVKRIIRRRRQAIALAEQ